MNEPYMQLTRNLHRVIHSYYIIVRNLIHTERFVLNLRILELVSDKLNAEPLIHLTNYIFARATTIYLSTSGPVMYQFILPQNIIYPYIWSTPQCVNVLI